jgi:hypothetical protein
MASKRRAKGEVQRRPVKRAKASARSETAIATAPLYRPLRGNQFRLLTILAGSDTGPIACSLNGHNIGTAPDYEALSYVWGDRCHPLTITVNGKIFQVTRNLYAALRRLRLPDQNRRIWIDAICIDQQNTDERSHQVQRMAQIYSAAVQVVVWLGDKMEERKACIALRVAEAVADACEGLAKSLGEVVWRLRNEVLSEIKGGEILRRLSVDGSSSTLALPVDVGECWEALDYLYAAPWFSRIWCFQEAALASKCTILVGEFITTSAAIGLCALWLIGSRLSKTSWQPVSDRAVKTLSERTFWERSLSKWGIWSTYDRFCWKNRRAAEPHVFAGCLLLKVFAQNRGMRASDDRDKVYAVLGVY